MLLSTGRREKDNTVSHVRAFISQRRRRRRGRRPIPRIFLL